MLVGAYIKRFDVCVAAIVVLAARVVYAQTQEQKDDQGGTSSGCYLKSSVLCFTYPADRWSNEGTGLGCGAEWMSASLHPPHRQVEFVGYCGVGRRA